MRKINLFALCAAAVGAVAIFSTANAGLLYEPGNYAVQYVTSL